MWQGACLGERDWEKVLVGPQGWGCVGVGGGRGCCLPLRIMVGKAAVVGEDLKAHVEKARRQAACRGATLGVGCRVLAVGCWVSGRG